MKNEPQTLDELLSGISSANAAAADACRRQWDSIAKPLQGLGKLEESIIRMAGALGHVPEQGFRRAIFVFCADNGVVEEGVTQTDASVTTVVTRNLCRGKACVSLMAKCAGAEAIPVDMGIRDKFEDSNLISRRIRTSTGNIAKGPAMTEQEAEAAILAGARLAGEWKEKGYSLLAAGEMGIGNTTTAAAVCCALLGLSSREATGRGAGLSDEGLARKREAVHRALAVNHPDPTKPLEVLARVGGLDIAGMTGLFLGGAYYQIPVVVDGLISGASALLAKRMAEPAGDYLIASHRTAEPAGESVLRALRLSAPLDMAMRQGEGTGAAALFPLLDQALAVFYGLDTFEQNGMDAYVPLGGEKP